MRRGQLALDSSFYLLTRVQGIINTINMPPTLKRLGRLCGVEFISSLLVYSTASRHYKRLSLLTTRTCGNVGAGTGLLA